MVNRMINRNHTEQAPTHEEIALRAYHIWEHHGRQQGHDNEYWSRAEHEITQHRQEAHAKWGWETSTGIPSKGQRHDGKY